MPGKSDNIRKNNKLKQYDYDFEAWNRSNENMGNRPTTKKPATNLSDRGYPSSRNPSSQPTVKAKTSTVRATNGTPRNYYAVNEREKYPSSRGGNRSHEDMANPANVRKQTSLGNPKAFRDLEKPRQTSLGNPKGLRDLDRMVGGNRSHEDMANPSNVKKTAYKPPKPTGGNSDIKRASISAKDVNTGWRSDKTKRYEAGLTKTEKKGTWNAEEEMKKRRAAAEAQGKGKWNAEEEMKKRREAAKASGKGSWNANEEMAKRKALAEAKKRGGG